MEAIRRASAGGIETASVTSAAAYGTAIVGQDSIERGDKVVTNSGSRVAGTSWESSFRGMHLGAASATWRDRRHCAQDKPDPTACASVVGSGGLELRGQTHCPGSGPAASPQQGAVDIVN